MGVQGLWPLLEPVGRRVKIEALANKTLAVDASVWLFQFIKAMRDEQGELIKNAHLLGFFRRICRLLFHKIRPVFVFDGATPALKKRTTIARRRQREQQDAKLRKTAEKLLLNQLKQHALGQLQIAGPGSSGSKGGKGRRGKQKQQATQQEGQQGEEGVDDDEVVVVEERPGAQPAAKAQAAQQPQSRAGGHIRASNRRGAGTGTSAAAAAAPSAAAEAAAGAGSAALEGEGEGPAWSTVDELLAAQLGADVDEEEGGAMGGSGPLAPGEGGDDEEEEEEEEDLAAELEMMIPADGELDPEVLSTLPPSLQLEVMMRLREQRVSLNREQFEARSGVPGSFSQFQLQQYLKSSALRRQVEQVREAVNIAASGGEAARRIAAEEGREYILHKEQAQDAEAGQDPTAAAAAAGHGEGEEEDALQICFEVPVDDASAEGGDSGSDLEWEDVEAAPAAGPEPDSTASLAAGVSKLHWRERMAQRQRYWSLSHGFQKGRALANWGKEEEPEPAAHEMEVGEEDAEFQAAIQLSLQEVAAARPSTFAAGGAGPSTSVAGPSTSAAAAAVAEAAIAAELAAAAEAGWSDDAWEDVEETQNSLAPSPPGALPPSGHKAAAASLPEQVHGDSLTFEDAEVGHPMVGASTAGLNAEPVAVPSAAEIGAGFAAEAQPGPCSSAAVKQAHGADRALPAPMVAGALHAPQAAAVADFTASQPLACPASATESLNAVSGAPDGNFAGVMEQEFAPGGTALTDMDLVAGIAASAAARPAGPSSSSALFPSAHQTADAPMQAGEAASAATAALPGAASSQPQAVGPPLVSGESAQMEKPTATTSTPAAILSQAAAGSSGEAGSMPPPPPRHAAQHSQPRPTSGVSQQRVGPVVEAGPAREPLSGEMSGAYPYEPQHWGPASDEPQAHTAGGQARPAGPAGSGRGGFLAGLANLSQGDLGGKMADLQREEQRLRSAHRAQRGQADAPTSEMYAECQELLQMFGIPYIIAPMEAESQCAWMDAAGLVDGVITDDNDVFLFGGQRVYRNIFSASKFVEEFYTRDVERELGLTREKLMLLALLLGSDYTPGISGVGIVNATEIVNTFPTLEDLKQFKQWVESPGDDLIDLLEGGSKVPKSSSSLEALFFATHKGARRSWDLPKDFPDPAVFEAYSNPKVDTSKDRFTFGRPDLELLRNFCSECFAWSSDKADELLLPVIAAFDSRQAQLTMDSFLMHRERFAKIKSKRLQKALGGIQPGLDKETLFDMPTSGHGGKRGEQQTMREMAPKSMSRKRKQAVSKEAKGDQPKTKEKKRK